MIFIRSFAKPKSRKDAVGFAEDVSYERYAAAAAIKRSKYDFDLLIRVQYNRPPQKERQNTVKQKVPRARRTMYVFARGVLSLFRVFPRGQGEDLRASPRARAKKPRAG